MASGWFELERIISMYSFLSIFSPMFFIPRLIFFVVLDFFCGFCGSFSIGNFSLLIFLSFVFYVIIKEILVLFDRGENEKIYNWTFGVFA